MNRRRSTSYAISILLMLSLSFLQLDCVSEEEPVEVSIDQHNEVDFRVEVFDGVVINTLYYTISRGGTPVASGELDISNASQFPFSFVIKGLRASDDYRIVIIAVSEGGEFACWGEAEFTLAPGSQNGVSIIVSCEESDFGDSGVDVEVDLNLCPSIDSVVFSPSRACIGDTVQLIGRASDPDADALDYSWTVDGAFLVMGKVANYTCTSLGTKMMILKVDDPYCSDSHANAVQCEICTGP